MLKTYERQSVKKTQSRTVQNKLKQTIRKTLKKISRPVSFNDRFEKSLRDIQRSSPQILSYNADQLELICQRLAIQQMSSASAVNVANEFCPLICLFCQNLIHEPLTLLCGHTYCENCIKDEQISSMINCPRCLDQIQGQVQSSIVHARELSFSRNHFLKQIFQRSEYLTGKYQLNSLYHKGKVEFSNGNYQQAIEIYSKVLEQNNDHHLALCDRAKSYFALNQFEKALADATRVVSLKPQWSKGHLCQSEILFELNRFKSALFSSLKALVIHPDDSHATSVMARHLHTVLHNNDDEQTISTDSEPERFRSTDNESTMSSNLKIDDNQLTMCKFAQSEKEICSSSTCLCTQLDYKNLRLQDFECSICVNLLWFPISTPCGHVFCRECLIRAVDNTQIQCPICKTSLKTFFPLVIKFHVNQTELISTMIQTYFPIEYSERRQLNAQENMQGAIISPLTLNDVNSASTTIFEVPIFVCVLALPFCVCPLHVFEPCYRLMMRRTMETESRTFGMCTYDEHADDFSGYGTLLYIRNLVYTPDGRSIVDTIGRRRFRVLDRGTRDGYNTARVELIQDQPIEQYEFDDLFQLNRRTYGNVRDWYNGLDNFRKALIEQKLEEYPSCDDLTEGSTDGPSWAWIILNLLPINTLLQYTVLASQSFRTRLQIINDAINFFNHQHQIAAYSTRAQ